MTAIDYQSFVPTEGGTIAAADWCELVNLVPAGALTALTVNPPKQMRDKQPFAVSSTKAITTMTLTSLSGQNIQVPAVPLTAGGPAPRWVYDGPTNTLMVA